MGFWRRTFFATPWHLIRFFIPFTAVIPLIVYRATLFTHVYPGYSAVLTATSAGLCPQDDLSYPLFAMAARWVAGLSYTELPVRLSLFCAICAGLAVSLFYLLVARLVFLFACEDPGGAMAAMPPRLRGTDDDADEGDSPLRGEDGLAMNADGTLSIPISVQAHNRRVAHAAVLGGLGAASVLAFCVPFWLVATRLYPFAFDLLLFFLIINLIISYDQRGNLFSLFTSVLLLGVCCVESPLFLLLMPIGGAFLLRSMVLNGHVTTCRVLFVVLTGLAGLVLAMYVVWQTAEVCAAIPVPAPRPILNVFLESVQSELFRWIPSFGWSFAFVQFLFPASISFFVFSHAFRRRTPLHFFMQLALAVPLLPTLLNLNAAQGVLGRVPGLNQLLDWVHLNTSIWGGARLTSKIPIYQHVVIALFVGLLVSAWFLMREMFQEAIDEDLDYYEYRDNPMVCRIGAMLCWPLLALALLVPYFSYPDIDPEDGQFADRVAEEIYRELDGRDWIVNIRMLKHHLMVRAHRDGRHLTFLSTEDEQGSRQKLSLEKTLRADPSFESGRNRLINAADLSTAAFLREWFRRDKDAFKRVVLFDSPELWRDNGFLALPTGFFLSGVPSEADVDTAALLARHQAFDAAMRPLVSPKAPDQIRYYAYLRKVLNDQLARMANELGVLLVARGQRTEAGEWLNQASHRFPDNLSIALNRYELIVNKGGEAKAQSEIEAQLHRLQQNEDTFALTVAALQMRDGTLLNQDILDYVRKNIWNKGANYRHLKVSAKSFRDDPLTVIRDKKRELVQTITRQIDANEFDDADRHLNLLLDLDDKDPFALINKARIAIERRDLPEAGLWMDLAKENGVPDEELVWHEAALLILDDKKEQARELLNAVIPSRPGDIRLWGLLAEILLLAGEYPELENRVYPALRSAASKREHYLMHMVRGYILRNNGPKDYPLARNSFRRALELNPHLREVREDLLRLDDALNVPAFCEEDAKEVLRRDPEHAFANYLWGSVRLRRGELDLAEDLFTRSLEKERNAPAYAGLGAVLLERGAMEQAEKFLRRSLELDKQRLFTWHTLARLFIATGRLDKASHALETVMAGMPDDLEVRLTWINLLIRKRQLDQAVVLVSDLLDDEDLLPPHIRRRLTPLAAELSAELSK
ncbi:MAG TPA: tetratricopeptide repeat protein [Kiritimatiellia bacterium]|nr:tetratricopeptide repeat protein [Kiritimatiellia bacterium]HRU70133.1 tetratricopeptide repeat protein [Kiritimatiellia bacterium]